MKNYFLFTLIFLKLSFAHPITLVMIDSKTEKALGAFPISRAYYAQAIDVAKKHHAKGLILKFFFDEPKSVHADSLLARAIQSFPVFIQASVNGSEIKPNALSPRFERACPVSLKTKELISGNNGILPLPRFSEVATGVGFVNLQTSEFIPMVVAFNNKCIPSLWLNALEVITGTKGHFDADSHLFLGKKMLQLNKQASVQIPFPKADTLSYISFVDFIQDRLSQINLKNQLIIVAYDGENQPQINTPSGSMKAHRLFLIQLTQLLSELK